MTLAGLFHNFCHPSINVDRCSHIHSNHLLLTIVQKNCIRVKGKIRKKIKTHLSLATMSQANLHDCGKCWGRDLIRETDIPW